MPELIDAGVDGLIVPPNDPAALGEALAGLVGDPDGAFAMGRRGREKAEREFAPDVHMERLNGLYAEAQSRVRA